MVAKVMLKIFSSIFPFSCGVEGGAQQLYEGDTQRTSTLCVLGIESMLWGLEEKCLYLLSHFASPWENFSGRAGTEQSMSRRKNSQAEAGTSETLITVQLTICKSFKRPPAGVAQRHQHAVCKHNEECSAFMEGWLRVSSYVRNRS